MKINEEVTYYAELEPDARGFQTFLEVKKYEGKIVSVRVDGVNYADNPYGPYKSLSEKYNHDMHEESNTYYRDAKVAYENSILEGGPLIRVQGAGALYNDLLILLDNLKRI